MLARGLGSRMRDEGDFDGKTSLQFFFFVYTFFTCKVKMATFIKTG